MGGRLNTLVDEIDIIAKMDSHRPAVVVGSTTYSYGDLATRIRSTESWMMTNGMRTWQVGDMEMKSMNAPNQSNVVMVSCRDPFAFLVCSLAALDVAEYVLALPPSIGAQAKRRMIKRLHVSRILRHTY